MNEPILQLDGKGKSACALYSDKVVLIQNRFREGAYRGRNKNKEIPLESITAVNYAESSDWTSGFLEFCVAGNADRPHLFWNVAADENVIYFRDNAVAMMIKDYIEAEKASRSAEPGSNATQEISKYRKLLDVGAITQEEFDAKKYQLLGL